MKASAVKRTFFGLVLVYVLYLAGGIALAAAGVIKKVYFWPGWSIKAPNPDVSTFSADGPIVLYRNGAATSTAIVPQGQGLAVATDTLKAVPGQRVRCYVQETNTAFNVALQPEHQPEPSSYAAPARMLVVSDIEGNFKGLSLLLQHGGVMDKAYNWQFGSGHLVVVGDIFDRGLQVTECLWLLYKLDQESKRAGGKVHVLLGNHEFMNLTGHYKYLRRKYQANADSLGIAYADWYGPQSELGRWLRSKNVAEKIGATLFVHGGISPELLACEADLPQLNAVARRLIDQRPRPAAGRLEKVMASSTLSPDWYRGLALREASPEHVQKVLQTYLVSRLVIGHTPVEEITPLYQGQVIAIDLPHQQNIDEQGLMKALWVENDSLYTVRTDSKEKVLLRFESGA